MRYSILGAGGIGGLIGCALARAGHPVTLILRPETYPHHPAYLSVESSVLGNFQAPVNLATELVSTDVVWVTVKATHLEQALASMSPERAQESLIIPLLNGVDHLARLRTLYRGSNVVAGTIRGESERTAPGVIKHSSPFAVIQLAAVGSSAEVTRQVAQEVGDSGLVCEVVHDEPTMMWSKLAFLAPVALTTTASASTLGEVRAASAWRNRLNGCMKETCLAAQAAGAEVDADKIMKLLDGFPDNLRSSMQKDVAAGRPPELDAIGGPIVRAGISHGFDTSTTQELMRTIRLAAAEPA